MHRISSFITVLACAACGCSAFAQPFPNKTVRIIGAFMKAESEKWGRVIREANIKAE